MKKERKSETGKDYKVALSRAEALGRIKDGTFWDNKKADVGNLERLKPCEIEGTVGVPIDLPTPG